MKSNVCELSKEVGSLSNILIEVEHFTKVNRLRDKEALRIRLLAEELRVFYVALTRAEEKLIVLSTYNDFEQEVNKKLSAIELSCSENRVEYPLFRKNTSYADWILESLLINDKDFFLKSEEGCPKIVIHNDLTVNNLQEVIGEDVPIDEDKVLGLKQEYSYVYPYSELLGLQSKASVTEIVHKADDRLYSFINRPAFMQ